VHRIPDGGTPRTGPHVRGNAAFEEPHRLAVDVHQRVVDARVDVDGVDAGEDAGGHGAASRPLRRFGMGGHELANDPRRPEHGAVGVEQQRLWRRHLDVAAEQVERSEFADRLDCGRFSAGGVTPHDDVIAPAVEPLDHHAVTVVGVAPGEPIDADDPAAGGDDVEDASQGIRARSTGVARFGHSPIVPGEQRTTEFASQAPQHW
jgi:hypothetical protein